MVFSSILFILYFLPVFLLLYFIVSDRFKNYVLLIASLAFYTWGGPNFVLILVGTTFLDYYIVDRINKSNDQIVRKWLLAVSISITVGVLLYFKYANFFIENVNEVLSLLALKQVSWVNIALPIGISFFSFQKLTYVVDVYSKRQKTFDNPFQYLLFIIMFPQLIAGPIIRFNEIASQIVSRRHSLDRFIAGFLQFSIGLAKKVLIANVLGNYADLVFEGDLSNLSSLGAWVALLAYTFQIYFDFAGYSDMAIGIGKILGFRFPENFNSPYISQSISEFWRRWHITLGRWMRDYLYIPLGGNRVDSKARLYFNLILVFFISGLWHGASWNFVLWGLIHGAFLILDRVFLLNLLSKVPKLISICFTFLISMLAWVVFRIEDMNNIHTFYSKLFSFTHYEIAYEDITELFTILTIAWGFSFLAIFPSGRRIQNYFYQSEVLSARKSLIFMFVAMILLFLSIASITASDFNPFIYFRF